MIWIVRVDREDAKSSRSAWWVYLFPTVGRVGSRKSPESGRSSTRAIVSLDEKCGTGSRARCLDAATIRRSGCSTKLSPCYWASSNVVRDKDAATCQNYLPIWSKAVRDVGSSESGQASRRISIQFASARHSGISNKQPIRRRGTETTDGVKDADIVGTIIESVTTISISPSRWRSACIRRSKRSVVLASEI